MKNSQFHSSSDFVKEAQKKLPKFVFDFIDGGAGNEDAVRLNVNAFREVGLIPHIKSTSSDSNLNTKVLGLNYSAPFGIAPLGLCGLIHPNADIILAKVAAKYNVPYIMSAASNKSIDAIVHASNTPPWFQLYVPKIQSQLDFLLRKAEAIQCPVLVITVDTSVPGKRLRDLRNGLKLPYRLNRSNVIEAIKHPRWTIDRLLAGELTFPNFDGVVDKIANQTFGDIMSLQTGGNLDWELISKIRQRWKNKLVLKGVLSPQDAIHAEKLGVDAVIISNHGGRQLNSAPAPVSLLPAFSDSGLEKKFVMLDSGIRNSDDVIISLARGASFVFMGRLFLYALAAKGESGVENLFDILFEELTINLKLLGVSTPSELSRKNCHTSAKFI